jgi:hypothetical protein
VVDEVAVGNGTVGDHCPARLTLKPGQPAPRLLEQVRDRISASLGAARATALTLGGEVFSEHWQGTGFVVCNAMDPEGNVFQVSECQGVRSRTAAS